MADGERTVDDVLADLKAMKKELKVSAVRTRRGDQTSDCTCTVPTLSHRRINHHLHWRRSRGVAVGSSRLSVCANEVHYQSC